MVLRSACFAAAALCALAAPAWADEADTAQCAPANFRVYFAHDSASLDDIALQTMQVAERQMAGCAHAELRVAVDASSPLANQRAAAIRAAASAQHWDAVRVEPMMLHRAALSDGPEHAEVTMSPEPLGAAPVRNGAGV